MKAKAWMAAIALIGAGAFYAPAPTIAQDMGGDEAAEEEKAESYGSADEVMGSINELAKEFKNPRKPTDEELKTFFTAAWQRTANYVEGNPEATDHAKVYSWAKRVSGYGYGYADYVRLGKAYIKANPEAEDKQTWEDNVLLARLGVDAETEAAQKDLAEREKSHKDDATKLLEDYTIRMQWYDKAGKDEEKAKLIKKLDTEKVFAESKDEWVQRRIHRTIFANNKAEIKDGEAFPDWAALRTVKDIDGKEISIAEYKGKVVLLDFWAVWCGPCMVEMPNVIKLHEEMNEKGFEVIGISLDSETGKYDLEALKNTIAGKGRVAAMPWRQIYDGGGWGSGLAKYYGVNSIPKTVLIDQNGVVVAQGLRGKELDAKVKELLDKPVEK